MFVQPPQGTLHSIYQASLVGMVIAFSDNLWYTVVLKGGDRHDSGFLPRQNQSVGTEHPP